MCLPFFWEALKHRKMTKEIFVKFMNNNCTESELNEVIRWANSEAFNEESKNRAFDNWNNYQEEEDLLQDEKFSILFDKIQQRIDTDSTKNKNKKRNISTFSFVTTWLTRAAAILLIPVMAFLFYTLSEKKTETSKFTNLAVNSLELVAPIGSRTVIQLSDGTKVHLNSGSKLKYPQVFTGETREVQLLGEGYFDVVHNAEKPFIVNIVNLKIKALGTSFNVLAYPDEDIVQTTLVTGKVIIEQIDVTGKVKTVGTLVPGQHVNFNTRTEELSSTKGDVEKFIAWKDGKLVFDDASVTQVAERLSRMFNVDIEVAANIKDYLYTVTFIDEPLFQILDLMTIATPVSYQALPRKKLSDGSFSKQKIIITKRK